jgi:hypothetical protein
MTNLTFTLADYPEIRKRGIDLNQKILKKLSKDDFKACARQLKVWHNKTLVLDDENQLDLLMDYAMYAYRPHGVSLAEKYQRLFSQNLDPFEKALLQRMTKARYALYQIDSTNSEDTLQATDIFSKASYTLIDYQLARSAWEGLILANHLIEFDGFFVQTGVAVVATKDIMQSKNVAPIIDAIDDAEVSVFLNDPMNAAKLARAILTTVLQTGGETRAQPQDFFDER